MSKLYNGSICLTDITKEKIVTSEKNGKKYLNVSIWVNDDVDQFNNIGSIVVSQSKEEREAGNKKVYIGNFKHATVAQGQLPAATNNAAPVQQQVTPIEEDGLPF
jgi:hypothetical protein